MELLAKSMIAKFQEINKSSSVTKASEKSETIKNAYSKVEQGISNFMELVKLYNEKYAKEIADPSVANGIKEFMTNASANLQKA
jgi:phage-related protein